MRRKGGVFLDFFFRKMAEKDAENFPIRERIGLPPLARQSDPDLPQTSSGRCLYMSHTPKCDFIFL